MKRLESPKDVCLQLFELFFPLFFSFQGTVTTRVGTYAHLITMFVYTLCCKLLLCEVISGDYCPNKVYGTHRKQKSDSDSHSVVSDSLQPHGL